MHPDPLPQQQPYPPVWQPLPVRPLYTLGVSAAVLVVVAAIARAVAVHRFGWTSYGTLAAIQGDSGGLVGGYATGIRAIKDSIIGEGIALLVLAAAGVVFLVWLYRARVNTEVLARSPHRLGRGWAIGAWFVPLGNIVLPPIVMTDVVRGSRPGGSGGTGLVAAWWITVLAAWVIDLISMVTRSSGTVGEAAAAAYHSAAVLCTVEGVVTVIAALLLVAIIMQVSGWQRAAQARLGA